MSGEGSTARAASARVFPIGRILAGLLRQSIRHHVTEWLRQIAAHERIEVNLVDPLSPPAKGTRFTETAYGQLSSISQ